MIYFLTNTLQGVLASNEAPAAVEVDVAAKEVTLQTKKEKKMKKKKKMKSMLSKLSESDNASQRVPSPPPEPGPSYSQSPVLTPSVGNEETAVPFPAFHG